MAIAESQLDTWAKQGPTKQFTDTYDSVKNVLKSDTAPYHERSHDVYLQGSYGNDTNVYADSDVDVVICSDASFHYDLDKLPEDEKEAFRKAYPGAGLSTESFQQDVYAWLKKNYGTDVEPPRKAVHIKATTSRRACDVLICIEHRQYFRFKSPSDQQHYKGVQFLSASGTSIVNFPREHAANCTAKHQATNQWLKPTVRIFKNMRNRMIEKGLIKEGLAPSYYIEGALHNAPNDQFGGTFQKTCANCMNWLNGSKRNDLVTASGRRWLLREGKPDSWSPADFEAYLTATINFWNSA